MIVSTTFLGVVWLSLCVSHDYEVVADVGDGDVGGVGRESMRECSSVLRCGRRSAPRSIDPFRSLPLAINTPLYPSIHPHFTTIQRLLRGEVH